MTPGTWIPTVWCFGFTDLDESPHWLRSLIAWAIPPPRHVVCFTDSPFGLVVIQQTLRGIELAIQPGCTALGFTAEIVAKGGQVHVVPVAEAGAWVPRPHTCVDIARAIASMPYIPQTPRMLARELAGRR